MSGAQLSNIDRSYWKVEDKSWVVERKTAWPRIESYFRGPASKSKKALNIIKKYYLKGELPDFTALASWRNDERHLDLFCLLWLHPSWEFEVLNDVRDLYVNSEDVTKCDVQAGVALLFTYGGLIASYEEFDDINTVLHTQGHNDLLFSVILGDLETEYYPERNVNSGWKLKKFHNSVTYIHEMSKWLCNEKLNFLNEDCLYQYDRYLEYWYRCCPDNEDFFSKPVHKIFLPIIPTALYRIHNFDTVKEGDTCRTRFVHKIRNILDERHFITEFKQMWEDVKAGKIEVKDPWKR